MQRNNHFTVQFLLSKISENYKLKNLTQAMLRRPAKMSEKLWTPLYIVITLI